jgi:hypothetical protein
MSMYVDGRFIDARGKPLGRAGGPPNKKQKAQSLSPLRVSGVMHNGDWCYDTNDWIPGTSGSARLGQVWYIRFIPEGEEDVSKEQIGPAQIVGFLDGLVVVVWLYREADVLAEGIPGCVTDHQGHSVFQKVLVPGSSQAGVSHRSQFLEDVFKPPADRQHMTTVILGDQLCLVKPEDLHRPAILAHSDTVEKAPPPICQAHTAGSGGGNDTPSELAFAYAFQSSPDG